MSRKPTTYLRNMKPEQVDRIREVLSTKISRADAAERFEVSTNTIDRWIRQLGLSKGHKKVTPEIVAEMKKLQLEGWAISTIAKRTGFLDSTVKKHLEEDTTLRDDPINKFLMSPMSKWGQCFIKEGAA